MVIPASIRTRHDWAEGTTLLTIDTDNGVILMERQHAMQLIRDQLAGRDPVAELMRERRREAERDDE